MFMIPHHTSKVAWPMREAVSASWSQMQKWHLVKESPHSSQRRTQVVAPKLPKSREEIKIDPRVKEALNGPLLF